MLQRIGKYEIKSEIGYGAFGFVYLAYDRSMDRQVAVKVLKAPDDPSQLARFRAEARSAGNLHHPNIVTIHEYGEEQNLHYIVMEFLDGRNLKDLMKSNEPATLWQKVDVMSQVAEGLECAHQHGVVHRDVKPANIVCLKDGKVKILDFGIARLTQRDTTLTQSGYLIGTIPYMAPELFDGDEGNKLCDIWAYGVVYYELLTGRHPFGNWDMTTAQWIKGIRNRQPEPVTALAPDCPEALDHIVARLLDRNTELRYQTLGDVVFDLQPLLLDLKRRRASELTEKATALVQEGRFGEVESMVRSARSLDPANEAARKLGELVRQKVEARSRREELKRTAEAEAARRNFPAAIHLFGQLKALDPASSGIEARIEALRSAQKQQEVSRRLLARAKQQLEVPDFTAALQLASAAAEADPQDPEAAALLNNLRNQIAQRDRQRNIQEGVARAKDFLTAQSFGEALGLLEGLAGQYPDARELQDLIREAHQQEKLAWGKSSAKSLLARRAFGEAIELLDAMRQESPGDPEITELLSLARGKLEADSAEKAGQLAKLAWELARRMDFEGALELVEKGLQDHPGEAALLKTKREILAARTEHQRVRDLQDQGLARCREMRAAGAIDGAFALASTLVRDYPGSAEIHELWEQLRREIEAQKRAREREEAITAACSETQQHLDAGRLTSAREGLDRARRDFGPQPGFDDLEAKLAERGRIRSGEVDAAWKLRLQGDLAQAENKLNDILQSDPLDPEAKRKILEVRRAQDERQQRYTQGRQEAERYRRQRQFDAAIRALSKLLEEFPGDSVLEADLQAVRQDAQRAAATEAVARGRAEALRLLKRRDFDGAIRALRALQTQFPQEHEIDGDLEEAERTKQDFEGKKAIAAGRKEGDRLLAQRDFDGAIRCYESLIKQFPSDPLLPEEIRNAKEAKERRQRKEEVEQGRAEADRRISQGDFDQAIELLEALARRFPQDLGLAEELRSAKERKAKAALREKYSRGVEEAQGLQAEGRLEDAIRLYESLLKERPGDPALTEGLRSAGIAQRTKAEEERKQVYQREFEKAERLGRENCDAGLRAAENLLKQFPGDRRIEELRQRLLETKKLRGIDEQITQLEKLWRKSDTAAVQETAERILGQREDPRARQYLEWAKEARVNAEREAPSVPPARAKRQVWPWAALPIVLVLAVALVYWLTHSSAASLVADSVHLTFTWKSGAPPPAPRKIAITSKGAAANWTVSAAADWMKAVRIGTGSAAEVEVSIDPSKIRPGQYTAPLTISGGGIIQMVNVSLSVEAATGPPSELTLSQTELPIFWKIGTTPPEPQKVTITAKGASTAWTVTNPEQDWLKAERVGPAEVRIAVNTTRLAPQQYFGPVLITGGGITRVINIKLTVEPAAGPSPQQQHSVQPSLKVDPAHLSFLWIVGKDRPAAQKISVVAQGPATDWKAASGAEWLSLSQSGTGSSGEVKVEAGMENPRLGDFPGQIEITGGGLKQQVSVSLSVQPPTDETLVNCHAGYLGYNKGILIWSGNLAPTATLWLAEHYKKFFQPGGTWAGQELPGCAVELRPPANITIEEPPKSENNFGRVLLRNNSSEPVRSIRLEWQIK